MTEQKWSAIGETESDILVKEREKIDEPKRYIVVLHNDDFTTQEFVVHVLVNFFHKNDQEAHRLMLKVHLEGKAAVGKFIKDIAESKVALITSHARQNGMPLLITAEPE